MKSSVLILAASLAAVGCASSENSPQSRYFPGQKLPQDQSIETGKVSRFITNPQGEVDGFLLEDGVQVHFPPQLSTAVTKNIAVGDMVNIKGDQHNNAIWAKIITMNKNANVIDVRDSATGKWSEHKSHGQDPHMNADSLSVSGEIDTLLKNPQGDVDGFILTEGSVVHLPPDVRKPDRSYDVGQYVEVTGRGTENVYGRSIEASSVQRQRSETTQMMDTE